MLRLLHTLSYACLLFSMAMSEGRAEPLHHTGNSIPSRVGIARSADPSCGKACAEWIYIEGNLSADTEFAFRNILTRLGKRRLPVLIHSGGGQVVVGLEIGRMIRTRELDVAVSRTETKSCDPKSAECPKETDVVLGEPHSINAYCASACTFILAGGFHRYVSPWSRVGVHQMTGFMKEIKRSYRVKVVRYRTPDQQVIEKRTIVGEEDSQRIVKLNGPSPGMNERVKAYFREMGVSPDIQMVMAATSPKDIYWLSHDEQDATDLVTDYAGGETLVTRSVTSEVGRPATGQPPHANIMGEPVGPELPVSTIAYGLFEMPGFGEKPAKLALELIHRKGLPVVELSAMIDNRTELASLGSLSLNLQAGSGKDVTTFVARSREPTVPLAATIPTASLCGDGKLAPTFKITLEQAVFTARVPGKTSLLDLNRMSLMPALLADACKPVDSAAH